MYTTETFEELIKKYYVLHSPYATLQVYARTSWKPGLNYTIHRPDKVAKISCGFRLLPSIRSESFRAIKYGLGVGAQHSLYSGQKQFNHDVILGDDWEVVDEHRNF